MVTVVARRRSRCASRVPYTAYTSCDRRPPQHSIRFQSASYSRETVLFPFPRPKPSPSEYSDNRPVAHCRNGGAFSFHRHGIFVCIARKAVHPIFSQSSLRDLFNIVCSVDFPIPNATAATTRWSRRRKWRCRKHVCCGKRPENPRPG